MRSVRLLFFCLFVALAAHARADDHWIEARSPHFRVLTNGSAADARKVAEEI